MSSSWRQKNLICALAKDANGATVAVHEQPLPTMPPELLGLFDRKELSKYLTEEELSVLGDESPPVVAARQPIEESAATTEGSKG